MAAQQDDAECTSSQDGERADAYRREPAAAQAAFGHMETSFQAHRESTGGETIT